MKFMTAKCSLYLRHSNNEDIISIKVIMTVIQNQAQSIKTVNNLKSHAQIQDTDMNKSHITNIMSILEYLMSRLLINTVMKFETVYHDMLKSMRELLL